ncbi:MAG TPA: type II toxin-antitoxin system VapC family toxin [Casimicrobiaceae bacterium]|nr:type II toxin-antitoxin system VapC family toxin [Casimicrobiaceae bacterium]
MIVVDASAVLEVLLNTSSGSRIADRLFAVRETLHAPHLLDVEVAHAMRRYFRNGQVRADRGLQALEDLDAFPVQRYAHRPFLARMWQLRNSVTACDAAYIALAEALSAPLVTRDAKLASITGHDAEVELI